MSGYFRTDFPPGADPLTPTEAAQYDLVRRATLKPPQTSSWILTSKQDMLSYPSTIQLLHDARPLLPVNAIVLPTGGHRDAVFIKQIPLALNWLGATLAGFAPSHHTKTHSLSASRTRG